MHLNKIGCFTMSKTKLSSTTLKPDAHPVKVFLIGMMGSGKSYWAEKLKKKLKLAAYDLDNLVEMIEERTIAEIFEQSGEEYFRKEEAKMLRLFKEKKQFILSCGGGTPCYGDNIQWMNKNGITIWIDEPVDVLTQRLLPEKEHRPLIRNQDPSSLNDFLSTRLKERSAYYSQAQYTLSGIQITESNFIKIIKQHA